MADRAPRSLAHAETLPTSRRELKWINVPHVPHAWECGYLFDYQGRTLMCGDLFTQGDDNNRPWTESDILEPSEDFRRGMDYYSLTKKADTVIERVAGTGPKTLACMHGSAWADDGTALLRALGQSLQNG